MYYFKTFIALYYGVWIGVIQENTVVWRGRGGSPAPEELRLPGNSSKADFSKLNWT